ncbi:inositol hexakisphosphate-domain-containing protein [Schizophyllum fasciatum]
MMSLTGDEAPREATKNRHSYQVINNLLRVVRRGPTVKNIVDDAIDQCAIIYNVRDSIEESRSLAEQASDEKQKRALAQKGVHNLRRYFELIVFQSYLQSIEPDTMQDFESIETFVKGRPVIKTFERELLEEGANALKPLERSDVTEDVAHPDEVRQVVLNRSGSVLSASTILKSDFFSNLQKMTLPEQAHRRRAEFPAGAAYAEASVVGAELADGRGGLCDRGLGGWEDGLRERYAHSAREPVIYVAGRPHVLRLVDRPLENVEATGVSTPVVEDMEKKFKQDILVEVRLGNGRVLLHDEVEERPGVFSIIPIWESVTEDDIMTPRDVFDLMVKEGYKINYGRVAITDEQAPLPDALSELLERVRTGYAEAGDFVFNCQMGRGRTTSGMITACLISTVRHWAPGAEDALVREELDAAPAYDPIDGPSEEEAYLQGEYKTILQLVGVLSHGKAAKRLTDRAVDLMQDVQNLRKAIYDYKLKAEACEKGSGKERKLRDVTINYLYRYGTLIVFANYLIEMKETSAEVTFPVWLAEHREITKLLGRRSLD